MFLHFHLQLNHILTRAWRVIVRGQHSEEEAFHVVRHPRPSKQVIQPPITRNLTCKEIEERAWRNAKLKFPDGKNDLPPPPEPVELSVIDILITEALIEWMPKKLVEDPQSCADHLYKMLADGIIGEKISLAFGHWYFRGDMICFISIHVIIPIISIISNF